MHPRLLSKLQVLPPPPRIPVVCRFYLEYFDLKNEREDEG